MKGLYAVLGRLEGLVDRLEAYGQRQDNRVVSAYVEQLRRHCVEISAELADMQRVRLEEQLEASVRELGAKLFSAAAERRSANVELIGRSPEGFRRRGL